MTVGYGNFFWSHEELPTPDLKLIAFLFMLNTPQNKLCFSRGFSSNTFVFNIRLPQFQTYDNIKFFSPKFVNNTIDLKLHFIFSLVLDLNLMQKQP